jgi:hypothetical protein
MRSEAEGLEVLSRLPRGQAGNAPASARWAIKRRQMNGLISIVSVRPGPTPIAEIGAPDMSSSALT